MPEFNRLVEAAKKHYTEKVLLESIASVDQSAAIRSEDLKEGEEHSSADIKKILLGLNSNLDEEKTKFLSIALGGVTVLRKGC